MRCIPGRLVASAGLALLVPGCSIFYPALGDTNCRDTTAIHVSGEPTETAAANNPAFAGPDIGGVVQAGLGFVSSEFQAAVDADKARYSAEYSGSVVVSNFWEPAKGASGPKPTYKAITVSRLVPGGSSKDGDDASTFTIALDPVGDGASGRFLARPTDATIRKAMAKLLKGGFFSLGSWFADTTTLLNVEVTWKVEDLGAKDPTSSEVTVKIPGYDMTARRKDGAAVNYYAANTAPQAGAAGVLSFPPPASGGGLYRVTVTVKEKDPYNADRSVDAEKTLIKDLIDALKKEKDGGSGST